MPKLIGKQKRDKRLGLVLTEEEHEGLCAVALAMGHAPSVMARIIIAEFLKKHADAIAESKEISAKYQQSLKSLQLTLPGFESK